MLHARSDYNGRVVDLAGLIPKDEPVFLLRGQDGLAHTVVKYWANLARSHGVSEEVCSAAARHANKMAAWPTHKVPDAPEGVGLDGELGDEDFVVGPPREVSPIFDSLELEMLLQGVDEGTLLASDNPLIAKLRAMLNEAAMARGALCGPIGGDSSEEAPPQAPETS